MNENALVEILVSNLRKLGLSVATEVANFHRCADIAAINDNGELIIIECKMTHIERAIEQSRIHKLSADRVYIATFYKKIRKTTIEKIKLEGLGLIYVFPDRSMGIPVIEAKQTKPWALSRNRLLDRILNR